MADENILAMRQLCRYRILLFPPEQNQASHQYDYGTDFPGIRKTVFLSMARHIHGHSEKYLIPKNI